MDRQAHYHTGQLGAGALLVVVGLLMLLAGSRVVSAGSGSPADLSATAPGGPAPSPTCLPNPPTPVAPPPFTPAPGCQDTPPHHVLEATIIDRPTTTEAHFTNHSATCSYRIGLAVYKKFDANIEHQELFDDALAVIPPSSSMNLTVNNPTCAYQGDAFWGDLIVAFTPGVRYDERRLDDTDSVNRPFCGRECATAVPTTTSTPLPTATDTATPVPTNTPTGTATVTLPPSATPTATPTCPPSGWQLIPSPNIGSNENQLWDVGGLKASDVWAVGHYVDGSFVRHTMTQHWDGQAWTIIPSADLAGLDNRLIGLAVVSTNDVWAVGTHKSHNNAPLLIEHWDGNLWSIVPAPTPTASTSATHLHTAVALATDDVWTAGSYNDTAGITHALLLHWDGTAWSLITLSNVPGSSNEFFDLAAQAPDNVWLAGYYIQSGITHTLTMHWDGTTWSVVPSPDVAGNNSVLWRIDGAAPNDLWAAGQGNNRALMEHWDGQAWNIWSAGISGLGGGLFGLAVHSATDIWAVGTSSPVFQHNLTVHWDGSTWQVVPAVDPGLTINNFRSAAVLPDGTVWAVGNFTSGQNQTMIERVVPLCPSPTPTAPVVSRRAPAAASPSYTPTPPPATRLCCQN